MVNWVLLMQILLCLHFLQIFDFLLSNKFRGTTFTRKVKYRHQQDVLTWCIQEILKEASWCHVGLKSHNTWTKQLASSVVFGCLSLRFCTGRWLLVKITEKLYDLRSLTLRSVFYTVLVPVPLTNCNLL